MCAGRQMKTVAQDRTMTHKPVLGLIGGMGSGKSRVASLLAERGGRVVSGDRLGHEALRQADVREALARRWGPRILDEQGEVNRRAVGQIVFDNPQERRALEALVFPWIERGIREEIEVAAADPAVAFIVLDAAVMLEAGWDRFCDRLLYVDAPDEVRLRRLAAQRGWTADEVAARTRAQMPLAQKKDRADAVLDNAGPSGQTARRVDELLEQWQIAGPSTPREQWAGNR
jgi:dephospho-CoA kinase